MNLIYSDNVPSGLTSLKWLKSPELGLKTVLLIRDVKPTTCGQKCVYFLSSLLLSTEGRGARLWGLTQGSADVADSSEDHSREADSQSDCLHVWQAEAKHFMLRGKDSFASAWTPHLSRVQCVFRSQQCFCSHQRAKSDQSWAMSAE